MSKIRVHKKWQLIGVIIALFFISLSGFFLFSSPQKAFLLTKDTPKKPDEKLKPVIAILPHQDDEMFLGGTLHRLLMAGHPAYSIITTDGSGSIVRFTLNGTDRSGHPMVSIVKNRILNPLSDGYQPLDKQHFSAARNREYFASLATMGVPKDHIWFANPGQIMGSNHPIYIDGSLTKELAHEVIKTVFDKLGDGIYLAVASDPGENNYLNTDHRAIEDALKEFPGISEKFYFSDKEYPGQAIVLSEEEKAIKQKALAHYRTWDPKHGRFAVGEHSVKGMLDNWRQSNVEYVIPITHNPGSIIR